VADTIEDLEKKLEASRAARVERQKADEQARKIRMLQEETKLVELEATEGVLGRDIKAIFSPKDGSMIVVRTPPQAVLEAFNAKQLGKGPTVADLYDLIRRSLVYPDRAAMEKIFASAPGMLTSTADAVAALGGSATEDTAGK
jgi:hypothetical protein